MALSARPMNVVPVPSASSGRMASGSRGVASAVSGPVDAIGNQNDIQTTTQFNYESYADLNRRQKKPDFQPLTNTAGKFETYSTMFVSMLDDRQKKQAATEFQGDSQRLNPKAVEKAIQAYEGTALVIHGNPQAMGQTVSLSL
ncbi:MAG: hypothetical protein JKY92_02035 [Magnetovibrio sp.]|nr:hypothetical protein [Magnetovibrio sp.]